MMINVKKKKTKRQLQRLIDRKITRLEVIQIKTLSPIINRQFIDASKLVENNITQTDNIVDRSINRLKNNFTVSLTRTVNIFSQDIFKELDKIKSINLNQKDAVNEFQQNIRLFINALVIDRITKVNNTTKNIIRRIITAGISEGIGNRDIAKKIRKTGKITSKIRAITIARTETHTAAVKAMNETMRSSRIKFEHEWVSSVDDRTRIRKQGGFEHLATFPNGPNFERVSQDISFIGTGEKLKFPGDPNGSAGNIINCRCVEIFHIT